MHIRTLPVNILLQLSLFILKRRYQLAQGTVLRSIFVLAKMVGMGEVEFEGMIMHMAYTKGSGYR